MNLMTMAVIVLGLVCGYWVVAAVFKTRAPTRGDRPADETRRGAATEARENADTLTHWTRVLGVLPSASPDEIRAAYRHLMSQYHPDKVSALGVELQALAERKSKEIGTAYREAMAARGTAA